ncbi:Conjugal transfer protein TraG [Roseobacter fucihabitans]|uniref:Conjugal transfer protein TraG n=1 Tax=Roseobacter fucihabitans TaxID=1537242 RepID=A0ABZ2BPV0_9RHOB|nr:type IV secretory system conjugative DNA transfer family protein [Roseobacter litoralis]MBC6964865.1 Conjugal transfer protein TraG [Roseobacter litoralis]MBC6965525.1 Conjugal transfer protein TraG [Roseobacter litoralis]
MKWQTLKAALPAVLIAACVAPHPALAQNLFGGGNNYNYYNDYVFEMTMARIIMMTLSVGSGFCLGWFLSPQAKELRRIILLCMAGVVVLLAVFNNDVLGWGAAWIVSFVGFFAALGYWIGRGVQAMLQTPTTFGSSEWATIEHMKEKGLLGADGIILGSVIEDAVEKVFSYKGDRHLLTSAPTRSGKGVSHIIVNLLCYLGSMLVIDPKGENARITAKARRAMGQTVHCVDPWHISGEVVSRFNPLDWIDLGDVDATENAMLLADALVQKDSHGDSFWAEEAKALLQGLILLVAFDEAYQGRRHLGTVRDLLLLSGDELEALFQQMANSPHHIIASTGSRSLQKEAKLMANVLASAQAETHMLDSARLRESLSASDFTFEDLKKMPMTIYLILPSDRLGAFGRFLRLLVQQAITVNARNIEDKPKKPVLFILDEMPTLGRLTMVEQAYGLMAGFGIQLWGITQDLCQLRKVYGEDYESFIGNSGAVAYFGSPDKTSAEYFSDMCGVTTVWNFSTAIASAFSSSSGAGGGSSSNSTTNTDNRAATQRKLAYPDELMRLREGQQLILIENTNPIMAKKIKWYEDPEMSLKGVNTHKG